MDRAEKETRFVIAFQISRGWDHLKPYAPFCFEIILYDKGKDIFSRVVQDLGGFLVLLDTITTALWDRKQDFRIEYQGGPSRVAFHPDLLPEDTERKEGQDE